MSRGIVCENFLEVDRTGLERTDELKIIPGESPGREELVRRDRKANFRKPVLPALFRGFDRDRLPFRLFLRRALGIELNDGAGGKKRDNFRGADLDRFCTIRSMFFPFGMAWARVMRQRNRGVRVRGPMRTCMAW